MRSESLQLSLTLSDPMHCSPPGSFVHGILQARILEWVAISSCRESFQHRDWTWVSYVSYIGSKLFTTNATWEAPVLYNRSLLVICSILNIVVCVYSQQWTLRCTYPFKLWFSSDICPGMGLIDRMVQFIRSVVSDSLRLHEPQHTRPPCPSPTTGVHPSPCPLCWWCHPAISSSVIPFSSCPLSFPASASFQKSQLSTSRGQSIGVSASASVLPVNTQDWSPLGWTGWISFLSKGLLRVFSNTTVQKHQFFCPQLSL